MLGTELKLKIKRIFNALIYRAFNSNIEEMINMKQEHICILQFIC